MPNELPNSASPTDHKMLKPIADENSRILGWHCSRCTWKFERLTSNSIDALQMVLAEFDQHKCSSS
jgi:hypothetical protein